MKPQDQQKDLLENKILERQKRQQEIEKNKLLQQKEYALKVDEFCDEIAEALKGWEGDTKNYMLDIIYKLKDPDPIAFALSKDDFIGFLADLYRVPDYKKPVKELCDRIFLLCDKSEGNIRSLFANPIRNAINRSQELLQIAVEDKLSKDLEEEGKKDIKFTFTSKPDGKQIGFIVEVSYKDSQEESADHSKKYYIKSHSQYPVGSDGKSSISKSPPDTKELLVYKILEYVGFGPKTQFIFNPLVDYGLFIATQDSSYTKTPTIKTKTFRTASTINDEMQSGVNSNLTRRIIEDISTTEISQDKISITILDLLAKVMRLHDLNSGNFGNVEVIGGQELDPKYKSKWKIVDFAIDSTYDASDTIFRSFLSGNGGNTLASGTGFTGDILKKRTEGEKILLATEIIKRLENKPSETKLPFEQAVDKAFQEITNYLIENEERTVILGLSAEERIRQEQDLREYCGAIKANYQEFKTAIEKSRSKAL